MVQTYEFSGQVYISNQSDVDFYKNILYDLLKDKFS